MGQEASPEAKKLVKLLRELFQLDDAAKLDFGIYRVLAQRREEMERFLGELVNGIPKNLAETAGGDRERFKSELDAYERRRLDDGDDIDEIRGSKGYRERAAKVEGATDVRELARDVFRDLHAFFSRYWDEGDFMAVPRYDRNTYAIPYDGSEVALHWANKDQYYVKSTLFFNDMTVKDNGFPGKLRFVLASAVTDRDNNKGTDANKRRFTLADEAKPVFVEGKDLVVRLQYGIYRGTDQDAGEEGDSGTSNGRAPKQDEINKRTAFRILELAPRDWGHALGRETDDESEILRRLRRYTRGNTADFFIHKNLGKFLRRELDFFIKNEVFDLDNIDRADLATLDAKLKRVRALRGLAHDLIDWLHQIEDFQRRLFLKKKFVLRTDWAVTLDRIPKDLWAEIGANKRQVQRWKELFGIDELSSDMYTGGGTGDTVDMAFLDRNRGLLVETSLLPPALVQRLIVAFAADMDGSTAGIMVKGPNNQGLALLTERFREDVSVVYADPPYNTQDQGFLYKNGMKHSTWAVMIAQCLPTTRHLLELGGVGMWAIDDTETGLLRGLLDHTFGVLNFAGTVAVEVNPAGQNIRDNVPARSHDYFHIYARSLDDADMRLRELTEDEEKAFKNGGDDGAFLWDNLRRRGGNSRPTDRPGQWFPLFASLNGPRVDLKPFPGATEIWPIDPKGEKRIWRNNPDGAAREIEAGNISVILKAGRLEIVKKSFMPEGRKWKTVWTDSKYSATSHGTKLLLSMIPRAPFSYPKSLYLTQDCVSMWASDCGWVVDPFGGSGTTAHAVININRDEGTSRRFILFEMGEHFDTVLVPRILKATYSKDWKDGKPVDRKGLSALYKIIRLESYDDTLENITLDRPDNRQEALFGANNRPTGVGRDYLLHYMLHMEAGRSLLDKNRFESPFDYRIRAFVTHRDESGASWSNVEEVPVDLVETFNYLIGLKVKSVQPLGRDGDMSLARYVEGVRRDTGGDWTIKTLVVWRDANRVDNAALDQLFARAQFTEKLKDGRRIIADFDEVYVNGDNHLPNQRLAGERWQVTLIEEEFHRLMFDVRDEE